jgi:hypothetical protein
LFEFQINSLWISKGALIKSMVVLWCGSVNFAHVVGASLHYAEILDFTIAPEAGWCDYGT